MLCDAVKDAAVFTVDIKSGLPQVWAALVTDSTLNMEDVMKRYFSTHMIGAPTVVKTVTSIPRNSRGRFSETNCEKA